VDFIQHNHEPMRKQDVSPEESRKYKENENVCPFQVGEKKILLTHSKSLDTEQLKKTFDFIILKDISSIYIKHASHRIETITKENVTYYIFDGKYYVF